MDRNQIYFAKVRPEAVIPSKKTEDAGYDIYACLEDDFIVIPTNYTVLVPTGIASAFDSSKYIQIEERGSTGSKGIKKSAGVIDSGFRGEWFIAITNCNDSTLIISKKSKEELEKMAKKDVHGDLYIVDAKGEPAYLYFLDTDCTYLPCYLYYPASKAIAQAIVHEVPRMNVEEISYGELQQIESYRGVNMLGSTNK